MAIGMIGLRVCMRTSQWLALTWMLSAACMVHAADIAALPDPTRPPPEIIALLPASAGAAVLAAPRLQSVMISASGRSAIIDGQRYKVGDKIGDTRLVKISENEIVLASAGGRQTMTLFMPVKQVPPPDVPAPRRAPRNP